MPTACTVPGIWDQISPSPFMSRQQWQATNLYLLCQLLIADGIVPSMNACTVSGLWNQITGSPPYLSEQEFYAENINLLCQLINGGGGGSSAPTFGNYGDEDVEVANIILSGLTTWAVWNIDTHHFFVNEAWPDKTNIVLQQH